MRSIISAFVLLLITHTTAQVAHGGEPTGWGSASGRSPAIPEVALPALDRAALIANEEVPSGQIKYGVQRFVSADVVAQGQWIATDDQRRVCRLLLRSPGAVMISVQFDRFDLGPDAFVYLYDEARTFFIGGFTELNEQPTGDMATAVVPGDAVVIELRERDPSPVASVLRVASITHGYHDIFGFEEGPARDFWPGYDSSPCHNNVICPAASGWQDQKRAVTMFLRPDGNGCTGQLVNNTQTPGIPYYYMAAHCHQPTESQWVFYFNYESPTCVGSTGPPVNQTMTGAIYRAGYYYDDLILLELSSTPPPTYNVFYAGWDRSGNTPQTGTVIHHPLFDVKKITFNYQPATSYSVLPYTGSPITVKCWKNFWDSGIVEPVSSGSAMWDQNKRIVGHMYEGSQDCSNAGTVYTGCAKFSESWDGSSPGERLRDWLDPANTTAALDGYDPNGTVPSILVRVRVLLEGPYDTGSQLMNDALRTGSLIPLAEPYAALGYAHTGGGGGEATTNAVLNASGSNAIVDWVVLELRGESSSATVIASHACLLQRDGDIVDVDGTSDVDFALPADDYYIAVRHRNHLGIMSQNPQALSATATLKDFSTGAIATFDGTTATKDVGGRRCLWMGDATMNGQLKYTGGANDRDKILDRVGGSVPTSTVDGYFPEDVNLDGTVKYSGISNDRDPVLVNIGGAVPTNTLGGFLP